MDSNCNYCTDNKFAASGIVVIVLCGLPACGKSSLASAFVASASSGTRSSAESCAVVNLHHHVEYDHLQDAQLQQQLELLKQEADGEGDNDDDAKNRDDSSLLLIAWRQSRLVALHELGEILKRESKTAKTSVILMDDNFYLQSMRKQVYQTSQKQAAATTAAECSYGQQHGIYFGTVWIDTSVDTCLKRNHERCPQRAVPYHIIKRMSERFEAPGGRGLSSAWEQPQTVLRLHGSIDLHENVRRLQDFVQHLLDPAVDNDARVVPPTTITVAAQEEERVRLARMETQQSLRHAADQFWRRCVAATAALSLQQQDRSRLVATANRVRKHCL